MFIHLKFILLVYWLTTKIAGNGLPISVSYYTSLRICYFFSLDWLIFCHVIIYYPFLSNEGPTLKILDFTIRNGPFGTHQPFIYISKEMKKTDWLQVTGSYCIFYNKCCVLRRQCWNTIRNIKGWCTFSDEGPLLGTLDLAFHAKYQ